MSASSLELELSHLQATKSRSWALALPSGRVSVTRGNLDRGEMNGSIFLEGLKTARELVASKGIEALDALISEHEDGSIETTAINPAMEIR